MPDDSIVQRDRRRVSTHIQRMEREGVERVKMFVVIVIAYLVFWGPLFLVTLARPGGFSLLPSGRRAGLPHEVTLHIAFVHSFVNPALFLILHRGLRRAALDVLCCNYGGVGGAHHGGPPPGDDRRSSLRPRRSESACSRRDSVEEETFHSYPSLHRSYLPDSAGAGSSRGCHDQLSVHSGAGFNI
ncbi:sphingosine 1-phosphate receptor 4-like [Amphibalanus amphitrite]|uniref:sphingosine 1-phosphate receptor 4-like n=1 Tax=Amphibalanus amphitrite TaxID=1232801 RepID=UPI001C923624|nr:sphingosine 1-phosphate receptor 4-like [Amphibalanus amphitrite]